MLHPPTPKLLPSYRPTKCQGSPWDSTQSLITAQHRKMGDAAAFQTFCHASLPYLTEDSPGQTCEWFHLKSSLPTTAWNRDNCLIRDKILCTARRTNTVPKHQYWLLLSEQGKDRSHGPPIWWPIASSLTNASCGTWKSPHKWPVFPFFPFVC